MSCAIHQFKLWLWATSTLKMIESKFWIPFRYKRPLCSVSLQCRPKPPFRWSDLWRWNNKFNEPPAAPLGEIKNKEERRWKMRWRRRSSASNEEWNEITRVGQVFEIGWEKTFKSTVSSKFKTWKSAFLEAQPSCFANNPNQVYFFTKYLSFFF